MNEVSLPGARVLFSTRRGGVSEGPYESLNLGILTDDERDRVMENRRRLAGAAGLEPAEVAMGWQEHGADLYEWEEPLDAELAGYASPETAELPHVDGSLTSASGVGLLVLVADCLPVALASDDGRIAMLHCGWRPLAGDIIAKALEHFDQAPAAAVGPGIGACCYEVGEEVLAEFGAEGPTLDLRAIAAARLEGSDVQHVDLCTNCNPDLFFSHRRDGPKTGRQAGVVVRTP